MHSRFLLRQILLVALPLLLARAAETPKMEKLQPAGIVLDDADAQYTGTWVESTKQASYVGQGYRHDNHQEPGAKSARFTPKLTEPGYYEIRLLYSATGNRATNAQVTIEHAEGSKVAQVNQREDCMEKGVPRAVGKFLF